MTDNYYMNTQTGELLTANEAIHYYYTICKHKYNEAWTDEFIKTDLTVENSDTINPGAYFAASVNI